MPAAPQVEGTGPLPMNNTVMSSLPITKDLTLSAKGNVEGEGGLLGKVKMKRLGEDKGEGEIRCEEASLLGVFDILMWESCEMLTILLLC